MSCFAKVENGVVTQVIVATLEVIESGLFGDPSEWIETDPEGKTHNRYAGIGQIYDKDLDAFIEEKPRFRTVAILDEELEIDPATKSWKLKDEQSPKAKLFKAEEKRVKDKAEKEQADGKTKLK